MEAFDVRIVFFSNAMMCTQFCYANRWKCSFYIAQLELIALS